MGSRPGLCITPRTANLSTSFRRSSVLPNAFRVAINKVPALQLGSHVKSSGTALLPQALPPKAITIDASVELDSDDESFDKHYGTQKTMDIVKERTGWLAVFCVGLILAAGVVEEFDDLIAKHVELSFFVPLIMGHGGNTGSQTTCSVIRALALKQVSFRNVLMVVGKEASAGCIMGAALGGMIFLLSVLTHSVSPEVGLVVGISLPVVSLWSNGLGAFLTLASAKLHLDPAMTSAPLVTTIVDSTGLVIYFVIANAIISQDLSASLLSNSAIAAIAAPLGS